MRITKPQSFGNRVRGLRVTKGLSQTQLAKLAGIKQSSLSHIETGETSIENVKAPTLAALAKALETNPGYLQTGQATPVAPEVVSVEEAELLAIYRQLPAPQQLLGAARGMLELTAQKPTRARPFSKVRP